VSLWHKLLGAPDDLLESVALNLGAVLGSRRGHAGAVPVFGLGEHDVYEVVKPHIDALSEDMLDQVRRFEPRLTAPSIRYTGRDGWHWAQFELTGSVEGTKQSFLISFHVVLRDVRVTVRREG
jgi:predicted component of type VI protein secretion system